MIWDTQSNEENFTNDVNPMMIILLTLAKNSSSLVLSLTPTCWARGFLVEQSKILQKAK